MDYIYYLSLIQRYVEIQRQKSLTDSKVRITTVRDHSSEEIKPVKLTKEWLEKYYESDPDMFSIGTDDLLYITINEKSYLVYVIQNDFTLYRNIVNDIREKQITNVLLGNEEEFNAEMEKAGKDTVDITPDKLGWKNDLKTE